MPLAEESSKQMAAQESGRAGQNDCFRSHHLKLEINPKEGLQLFCHKIQHWFG